MSSVISQFYDFGDFRLDVGRRLLLRDQDVVPLLPKVFDTLLVLLKNQGRIVEKEELLREIWGGAAVEEVGLAKNISALRKALGESPGQHRFIATVPGRGYQFVADVKTPSQDLDSPGLAIDQLSEPTLEPKTSISPITKPASRIIGSRRQLVIALVIVLLGGAVVTLALYRHFRPSLSDRDVILLTDFVNQTGDSVFDLTLKQGLAVQLEQSPVLSIFPEERVRETLGLMRRSPDERLTPELGREICQRRGIKALVTGWIAPVGSHYAITLEATDSGGDTLGRVQKEAQDKEQILRALSQAASELRGQLGESVRSIRKFDALLDYTTASLDALRAYSLGYRERLRGNYLQAISLYQQAVELDPNFAFAYIALANVYRNTRQPGRAAECTAKAYALRAHVSERERLTIMAQYYGLVTGETDQRIDALKLYAQNYPRDAAPHTNLATTYDSIGEFDRALEEIRTSLRINPDSAVRHSVLGNILVHMGRFAEAKKVYQEAEARFDNAAIHTGLFRIAFVSGDHIGMEQQIKWASATANDYTAFDWQAGAAASLGQWRRSTDFSRLAVQAVKGTKAEEVAAEFAAQAALRSAILGRCDGVKGSVSEALSIERNEISLTRAALALSWCSDSQGAASLIDELGRRYPRYTVVNEIWLPIIRAATELKNGRAESAIDTLEPVRRYEAAATLWPQYVRGLAYLQLRNPSQAEAEFRKIQGNRGQDALSPLFPLSMVGLARAAQLKSDTPQARRAYADFLAQWKGADSDLPVLVEAREQEARMQR
ncbi:MAG TPA: winged helix-turn-helix domain-containing protein [Bryobacteraceae bacterium]|jgi:DNA-binding winged helix-turn-helix (wHTH) protein/tetratricopeptide (TPR) repeat protein|nr:winged helix-turn-helix domain-containing protein [Bryobacteraceae bacterium]